MGVVVDGASEVLGFGVGVLNDALEVRLGVWLFARTDCLRYADGARRFIATGVLGLDLSPDPTPKPAVPYLLIRFSFPIVPPLPVPDGIALVLCARSGVDSRPRLDGGRIE
jgi:hypothetical protein